MKKGYKRVGSMVAAVGLALSLLAPTTVSVQAAPVSKAAEVAKNSIIVKFKSNISTTKKASLLKSNKANVLSENKKLGFQVIKVQDQTVKEAVEQYSKMPEVEYAEPRQLAHAFWEPNDPHIPQQYGLQKMQVPQAWDVTKGSSSTVVAVVDTGVQANHEDLAGKVVPGYDFVDNDNNADDGQGHGTHVAGTVAANTHNNIGVAGVAPEVKVMAVRVLDSNGSGTYDWVANGITYAADNGAKVINMSLGGSGGSQALEDAVNYAWSKGVVIMAAAGNTPSTAPNYPAYYANCIAVAATDSNDAKASFSTHGSWVDVAAPGVDIISTKMGGGYVKYSGTSMATPHAAAVAALVASQGKNHTEVREILEATADKINGTGNYWAHGRLNAYRAVINDRNDDGGGGDEEDTFEPNDTLATAHGPINSGKAYDSYIFSDTDVDYYKFNVGTAGAVNISLTNLPGDYDLSLHDASGAELAKSIKGGTNPEAIAYNATSAGVYYVKVIGYSGAFSKTQAYKLTANFPAGASWHEEDKRFDTPHPYRNRVSESHTYKKAGAQKVAIHFSRLETEANFDFVHIKDKEGATKASFTGTKNDFWVEVDGDTITANLVSDWSITKYGYTIDKVKYYQ
ncbi:S8 family serine peptidase [Thermoactinomyces sp. DSM 45892]|uniref:S8 family serine peptidase n=1 Tax=Thermoactinomyces sp. DSM 45892 TaxID=1882753 RepID=UPI00089D35F1|nr:S8 family serine peptidase [Thermoactinomyces sp. DSM 45892]SDY76471.1 Serine protease, subtilisin family [Thermoactinomyces sp. DSM 45892]